MRIDIIWNQDTTQVDLADGVVTVGGGVDDSICIAGLPHALLSLELEGHELRVTAQRSVRIGNALFPARVPRLLIEGEDLKLPNDVILRRVLDEKKRESRKQMATAFVAHELLSGNELGPQDTRAATLTCVTGFDQGRTFPIPFDENFIGRADDAAIRIRDRAVSRRHARLVREKRDYVLQPLSSSMNGAYINGKLLKGATVLKTGDVIEVGQTVLRFDASERAPEERTFVEPQQPAPVAPKLENAPVAVPQAAEPQLTLAPNGKTMVSLETVLMSAGVLGLGLVLAMVR
jgi:pSer/pThr/pTyr-binding forkhead associated (FHA) protein